MLTNFVVKIIRRVSWRIFYSSSSSSTSEEGFKVSRVGLYAPDRILFIPSYLNMSSDFSGAESPRLISLLSVSHVARHLVGVVGQILYVFDGDLHPGHDWKFPCWTSLSIIGILNTGV